MQSVWSEKDEKANLYASGMKFVDIEAPTLERIDELLEEFGSHDID
ncbi:MAG: hypothetical protein O3C57_04480 [Verrucomicrobia bacterium]|nr:hypothetical protein [Verrucomicrobiota bacterium]